MEFLFRIKTEDGSFIEIDNEGVTIDFDRSGVTCQADAEWDELRDLATRVVRVIDPEGEVIPRELLGEVISEEPEEAVFPDIKQYQVPSRLFQN